MIRIIVKFFGPFRDLFGGRERVVDFPADGRLRQFLLRLCDSSERREQVFPGAEAPPPHVVIMKNGTPVHGQDGWKHPSTMEMLSPFFPFWVEGR
jgi:hypothetical protein